jgi:hypothetical protein
LSIGQIDDSSPFSIHDGATRVVGEEDGDLVTGSFSLSLSQLILMSDNPGEVSALAWMALGSKKSRKTQK